MINFQEQIPPGTFEHALHYLVDNKLDLKLFDAVYKNDKTGRVAYAPAILLKIILFAYSKGITPSREIAWCCTNNIIFMALSCQTSPHFTTIANFISTHLKAKVYRCKTLYNLYHILNHLNLFGGGYLSQSENKIEQLLAES